MVRTPIFKDMSHKSLFKRAVDLLFAVVGKSPWQGAQVLQHLSFLAVLKNKPNLHNFRESSSSH